MNNEHTITFQVKFLYLDCNVRVDVNEETQMQAQKEEKREEEPGNR